MRPAHLTPSSFAACLAALLLMVSIPASSWAIFGFFEKNKDKDSDPDARASQENAALALYNQATTVELAKNYGKARDIYRQVVHDFPTTNAAAQSQFKAAEMFELEGKEKKALSFFRY
jgi:outer membrane protein assembly factor BamD (BamD/ComL family)